MTWIIVKHSCSNSDPATSAATPATPSSATTAITASSNNELIVNANCVIPQLLDYLKEECCNGTIQLGEKEALDLATENGETIFDLPNRGREYAKKYLELRGTYLLLKVHYEGEPASAVPHHYTPLCDVSDKVKAAINNPKRKKTHLGVDGEEKKGRARSRTLSSQDKQQSILLSNSLPQQDSPKKDTSLKKK